MAQAYRNNAEHNRDDVGRQHEIEHRPSPHKSCRENRGDQPRCSHTKLVFDPDSKSAAAAKDAGADQKNDEHRIEGQRL